jgi:hypothetical protein
LGFDRWSNFARRCAYSALGLLTPFALLFSFFSPSLPIDCPRWTAELESRFLTTGQNIDHWSNFAGSASRSDAGLGGVGGEGVRSFDHWSKFDHRSNFSGLGGLGRSWRRRSSIV